MTAHALTRQSAGAYNALSSTEDGSAPSVVSSPAQIANQLRRDVFSFDSWKLSIPAALYVLQNSPSTRTLKSPIEQISCSSLGLISTSAPSR